MTISISYETDVKMHISWKKIIEEVVLATLDHLKCPYEAEVSVTIVDDEAIRSINSEFRDLDRSTDVLSFPLNEFPEPGYYEHLEEDDDAWNPETGELLLGDIVISAEHVIAQAEEYGHTRKRELAFLTCHSMLHLSGYDHMTDEEREVMEELQRTILEEKGYRR